MRLAEREASIQAALRISKIAPDYATKGLHIHVDSIELKVLPGERGTVVFKPVFNSQEAIAGPAIRQARAALADPAFRKQLLDAACKGHGIPASERLTGCRSQVR